ncbi:SDR family NAD(P)-dependent oxidoreductase [Bacillus sp. NPDC077027]|uniref:SDR family NAD(P)-dependent oxidoreductase n=1 Tax=Bacillus sp. NPDC077027 TaxID=3390548 RepID=UPI003D02AFE2
MHVHVQLHQKVALVTGSTDGFGEDICLALGRAGAHVFAHTFDDQVKAEAICDAVRKEGGKASVIVSPLTMPNDANVMVKQVIDTCGALHILVNQAEKASDASLEELSDLTWIDAVEATVNSAFLSCQAAARHMLEQKEGCVINVSSSASVTGDGGIAYATSKSMLNAMTKGLSRELKGQGIRVLGLAPPPLHLQNNNKQILGSVAHMTVFLSSAYGAFTDGETIMLDGGESAG